jgi:two-component system KDP operon response regulator KdpE
LIAGDKTTYATLLDETLSAAGYDVAFVPRATLLRTMPVANASLIMLELATGGPRPDTLCRQIRESHNTPIAVFGSLLTERDIVPSLDAGADDILSFPMRPAELLARVRAVIRRIELPGNRALDDRLVAGDIEISLTEQKAYRRGRQLGLSPIELRLLTVLVRDAGRPLSHAKLLGQVWGAEYADCRHYLRLYIRYLREKIEDEPRSPRLILNEWGTGYRLQASAESDAHF